MTLQLLKKGLEPLIVGRDGRAYCKEEWYESRTYHSGDQSNLLISDNQTRLYAGQDREMRCATRCPFGERRQRKKRSKRRPLVPRH